MDNWLAMAVDSYLVSYMRRMWYCYIMQSHNINWARNGFSYIFQWFWIPSNNI